MLSKKEKRKLDPIKNKSSLKFWEIFFSEAKLRACGLEWNNENFVQKSLSEKSLVNIVKVGSKRIIGCSL